MEEICVLKQPFLKIQSRADDFCLNTIIAGKEMLFVFGFSLNQLRKNLLHLKLPTYHTFSSNNLPKRIYGPIASDSCSQL